MKPQPSGLRDHWYTPPVFLEHIRYLLGGHIPLDPASDPSNPTEALKWYTPEDNGLRLPWATAEGVFCNPPFSDKQAWIEKAGIEHLANPDCPILMLVPGATIHNKGTRGKVAPTWAALGRIKFVPSPALLALREELGRGPTTSAAEDMVLLYWGTNPGGFSTLNEGIYPVYQRL